MFSRPIWTWSLLMLFRTDSFKFVTLTRYLS